MSGDFKKETGQDLDLEGDDEATGVEEEAGETGEDEETADVKEDL